MRTFLISEILAPDDRPKIPTKPNDNSDRPFTRSFGVADSKPVDQTRHAENESGAAPKEDPGTGDCAVAGNFDYDEQNNETDESTNQHPDWIYCSRYRPPKLSRPRKRFLSADASTSFRQPGRNPRVPFTKYQVAVLEQKFQCHRYLSSADVMELADFLDLSENRIKIWFQNRRAREKRDIRIRTRCTLNVQTTEIEGFNPSSSTESTNGAKKSTESTKKYPNAAMSLNRHAVTNLQLAASMLRPLPYYPSFYVHVPSMP